MRKTWNGAVAQLGERVVRNDEVSGSIPLGSTRKSSFSRHAFRVSRPDRAVPGLDRRHLRFARSTSASVLNAPQRIRRRAGRGRRRDRHPLEGSEGPAFGAGNSGRQPSGLPPARIGSSLAQPGGCQQGIGRMIVDRPGTTNRWAAEGAQRSVQRLMRAHLCPRRAAPRFQRREAGVDFDHGRTLSGQSVDRPDGQTAA